MLLPVDDYNHIELGVGSWVDFPEMGPRSDLLEKGAFLGTFSSGGNDEMAGEFLSQIP